MVESISKLYNRGKKCFLADKLDDAQYYFSQAIDINRETRNHRDRSVVEDCLYLRARTFYRKKLYKTCIKDCDETIKLNISVARYYHLRGKAHQCLGGNHVILAYKDFESALLRTNDESSRTELENLIDECHQLALDQVLVSNNNR